MNITGTYNCTDGGVYHITQIDEKIWWFGESQKCINGKPLWANVAHGIIDEDEKIIKLDWSDVPKGIQRNNGQLEIGVSINNNKVILTLINQTGNFGGINKSIRWWV